MSSNKQNFLVKYVSPLGLKFVLNNLCVIGFLYVVSVQTYVLLIQNRSYYSVIVKVAGIDKPEVCILFSISMDFTIECPVQRPERT
jgi:hypothetical protein